MYVLLFRLSIGQDKLIGSRYTVMTRKRGMEDPFNDVSKYSQKYKKQRRKVPQLDARPYVHEFFPAELYSILGVEPEQPNGKKKAPKKLTFSALDTLDPLGELVDGSDVEGENGGEDGETGDKKKGGLLQGLLGDGEGDGDDEDEEQEPEEEIEDDFGDDEEVCAPQLFLRVSKWASTITDGQRVTTMRNNILMTAMMLVMIGAMKVVAARIITKWILIFSAFETSFRFV